MCYYTFLDESSLQRYTFLDESPSQRYENYIIRTNILPKNRKNPKKDGLLSVIEDGKFGRRWSARVNDCWPVGLCRAIKSHPDHLWLLST